THGLLSRSGIIPLSLTFDTGGPMARSIYDVAAALGAMTGIDPADAATQKSEGKFSTDYTKDLRADALEGASIGIARDFLGADPDVDWVIEASLAAMRNSGATIVDVRFPKWLLDSKLEFYNAIRMPEFATQIKDYLATIGPEYPKTIQDMIDQTNRFTGPRADGARPIQVAGPCSSAKHRAELLRTTATHPCSITVCHWYEQPSRVSSLPKSLTRSSIQQRLAGPLCSPPRPIPLPQARPHRRRTLQILRVFRI